MCVQSLVVVWLMFVGGFACMRVVSEMCVESPSNVCDVCRILKLSEFIYSKKGCINFVDRVSL